VKQSSQDLHILALASLCALDLREEASKRHKRATCPGGHIDRSLLTRRIGDQKKLALDDDSGTWPLHVPLLFLDFFLSFGISRSIIRVTPAE
jgi:hypothetical protein